MFENTNFFTDMEITNHSVAIEIADNLIKHTKEHMVGIYDSALYDFVEYQLLISLLTFPAKHDSSSMNKSLNDIRGICVSPDGFIQQVKNLPEDHPSKQYYNTFSKNDLSVQKNTFKIIACRLGMIYADSANQKNNKI